jgi:ABC-type uncharacterized transport system involved in gliding motility auxiliary subunit
MMQRRQLKRTGIFSLWGLTLAFIVFIATNMFLNVWSPAVRLDVSEDKLYTLSDGTQSILQSIDEPLALHFFFSERLGKEVPLYASYSRRIRELLVEIVAVADGKVVLVEHNPEPFSKAEDLAVAHGVQGIPVDQGSELSYFGLSGINSVDVLELMPFFQTEREKLLEYDIMQMINTLSNTEPAVIGIMSSLPVMGDMSAQMQGQPLVPWSIAKKIKDNFSVINLPQSIDDLPSNIDVMMVVHPQQMNQRAIYELEQFLFRGGRAMIFVDPKAESDLSLGPNTTSSSTDNIQFLLAQWGIEIPTGRLLGDKSMALRINAGTASQPLPAEYLVWLRVSAAQMNQDDPVVSQLPDMNLASAGFIVQKNDSTLSFKPLITSSLNSNTISVDKVLGLRPNIIGLLDAFKPDGNSYVVAARLRGSATTAFANGPPQRTITKTAQELVKNPDRPQLQQATEPMNIILVADADLLEDRFWLRKQQFFGRDVEEQIASNADFVVNSLSNLSGSDKLLTLRSRGVSLRPFEKVRTLQQQSASLLQEKERDLQDKLKKIQTDIASFGGINNIDDKNSNQLRVELSLTEEQRAKLEKQRLQMLSTRQQLRAVKRNLREDVEQLETRLQFLNIGLMPIIVSIVAMLIGGFKLYRRRRYALTHSKEVVN